MVQLGIGGGGSDSVCGEFDPGDGVKVWREEDGEEAAAAVGVDEVGGAFVGVCVCGEDGISDVVGEWNKDGVVVLEKGVPGKLKVGVADAFPDGRLVVSDADVLARVVWGGVGGVDREGGVE